MVETGGPWHPGFGPPIDIPVSAPVRAAQKQLRAAADTVQEVADEIEAFQANLAGDEEAWFSMMGAGGGLMIRPQQLGTLGADKIIINGEDQEGRRVRAIQHVSQVNVVLVAVKADKPVRIGFGDVGVIE